MGVRVETPLEWPGSGTHASLVALDALKGSNISEDLCQRVVDEVKPPLPDFIYFRKKMIAPSQFHFN